MALETCGINFEPADLVRDLLAYGEPEAAEAVPSMSLAQLGRVKELAMRRLPDSGLISHGVCLAAIEVLEGQSRPLRRKRRVFSKGAATNGR